MPRREEGAEPSQTQRTPSFWLASWRWLWLSAVSLAAFVLLTRFWGLNRIPELVFDEVYYVWQGQSYLSRAPYFDVHPPVGKYLIAVGIKLGNAIFHAGPRINVVDTTLVPIVFRWENALLGSLLPLVVGAFAHVLTRRPLTAFLAALFVAIDGMFLVDSRFGLINTPILFFGMLGHVALLAGVGKRGTARSVWLVLAGTAFGASVCVKWNGGGYLLLAWSAYFLLRRRLRRAGGRPSSVALASLDALAEAKVSEVIVYLGVVPALSYVLLWIPHFEIFPWPSFFALHARMLEGHSHVTPHLYASKWFTWPLMLRPVGYYWHVDATHGDASKIAYDVTCMANPPLCWMTTAFVAFSAPGAAARAIGLRMRVRFTSGTRAAWAPPVASGQKAACAYALGGYAANFLPWVPITRPAFFYHYMEPYCFGLIFLAFVVGHWLEEGSTAKRAVALLILVIAMASFVYWVPLWFALPISMDTFYRHMWVMSWI